VKYFVLYGCETLSLTLREERRLRVFEKRVLRRIFGPTKNEVTREWRRQYIMRSLMICTAHPILLGDKIEKNEMGGTCSTYGREERRIQVFMGKPEGHRPLGRLKLRWEDNIKIDFQAVER